MSKKQTNFLASDITRQQIEDLARWWGFEWKDRPNVTAVLRQAVERVWTQEKMVREHEDISREITRA